MYILQGSFQALEMRPEASYTALDSKNGSPARLQLLARQSPISSNPLSGHDVENRWMLAQDGTGVTALLDTWSAACLRSASDALFALHLVCAACGCCRVSGAAPIKLPEALLAPDNPVLEDQARSGTAAAGLQAFVALLDQLGHLSMFLSWAGFLQCLTVVLLVLRLAVRW